MSNRKRINRNEQGQTLIIALFILGIMLILAGVFAGILSRTIRQTTTAKNRGANNDFAEAGIRYGHAQLVSSTLGADWRGFPTALVESAPDFTRDADAYYLRPSATSGGAPLNFPGTTRTDQGGPDGLGAFTRVDYRGGRALLRVRYAPGDSSIFSTSAIGGLRKPGLAKNYLVIESVGRIGEVKPNDPSQTSGRAPVQFRNYASQAQLDAALADARKFDEREITSRKLAAFAQIGITDYARSYWNKYKTSRPVELGMPSDLGVRYRDIILAARDTSIAVVPPVELGSPRSAFHLAAGSANSALSSVVAGGGSVFANADIRMYNDVIVNLNKTFGDGIYTTGKFQPVGTGTRLNMVVSEWNTLTNLWDTTTTIIDPNSENPAFSTYKGILRDGNSAADLANDPRSMGFVTPPSMLPNSDVSESANVSRYQTGTRDSGRSNGSANTGQYGHGEGIYIDNKSDFQIPEDEDGRRAAGGSASLVQDWLSPFGDGSAFRSGWQGPFYVAVGAFVQLRSDGFVVNRNAHPDQNPAERTWRRPDGTDSGLTSIRYRVGTGTDGAVHVVNTLTDGIGSINNALTAAEYQLGPTFNGMLYFDGNVRVRGDIPTDVQLTLVSNRTIYIEGNVLKGVLSNDVTSTSGGALNVNGRINRPSRSSLMLMAKDYVTLNPTMFTGPSNSSAAQSERGGQGIGGYQPIKISAPDGNIVLNFDYPLNPDPAVLTSVKLPVGLTYLEFDPAAPNNPAGTGAQVRTNLLTSQALEFSNPGPPNTFFGVNINEGAVAAGQEQYWFETLNSLTNTAQIIWASLNNPAPAPLNERVYGLGTQAFQQSPKFETVAFPLISPADTTTNVATNRMNETQNGNSYDLFMSGGNSVNLFLTGFGSQPQGNYLLGRAASVPTDVRIEASIYAEEGSFFVIPGDWFNPNPNDRRDQYETRVQVLIAGGQTEVQARALANQERLDNFGSTPYAPFYAEPIDAQIRIIGSVAENMPPPMAQQSEWLKKWGWTPTKLGSLFNPASGAARHIPYGHVSNWTKSASFLPDFPIAPYTPNLIITHDPVLSTGRVNGYDIGTPTQGSNVAGPNPMVRTVTINGSTYALPPMPRLPVSPTLAYFGEIK